MSLFLCALIIWFFHLRASNSISNSNSNATASSILNPASFGSRWVLPRHVRNLSQLSKELYSDLSDDAKPLTPRAVDFLILTAAIALCGRIELFRWILANRQCTIPGAEARYCFFHDGDMANDMVGMCAIGTCHL